MTKFPRVTLTNIKYEFVTDTSQHLQAPLFCSPRTSNRDSAPNTQSLAFAVFFLRSFLLKVYFTSSTSTVYDAFPTCTVPGSWRCATTEIQNFLKFYFAKWSFMNCRHSSVASTLNYRRLRLSHHGRLY